MFHLRTLDGFSLNGFESFEKQSHTQQHTKRPDAKHSLCTVATFPVATLEDLPKPQVLGGEDLVFTQTWSPPEFAENDVLPPEDPMDVDQGGEDKMDGVVNLVGESLQGTWRLSDDPQPKVVVVDVLNAVLGALSELNGSVAFKTASDLDDAVDFVLSCLEAFVEPHTELQVHFVMKSLKRPVEGYSTTELFRYLMVRFASGLQSVPSARMFYHFTEGRESGEEDDWFCVLLSQTLAGNVCVLSNDKYRSFPAHWNMTGTFWSHEVRLDDVMALDDPEQLVDAFFNDLFDPECQVLKSVTYQMTYCPDGSSVKRFEFQFDAKNNCAVLTEDTCWF